MATPLSQKIEFPKIILGTMTFGQQNTYEEAREQLQWAFENGLRFIDCAEMYPVPTRAETQGRTEEFIGRWLGTVDREKVRIATKVSGPGRKWIREGGFTVEGIRTAVEDSLRRLGTDYIDLYQIHWPGRSVPVFGKTRFVPPAHPEEESPIEGQIEMMARLMEEGKIRAYGLSNESAWGIAKFCGTAERFGLPKPVSVQNAYSLVNRSFENGTDEACWRENVALLVYSPLAGGTLTGKYLKDDAVGRFTLFQNYSRRYMRPEAFEAVRGYMEVAENFGLTPAELALGFVAAQPFVTSIILGATTLAQLQEDVLACRAVMTEEIIAEIEKIHHRIQNPAI